VGTKRPYRPLLLTGPDQIRAEPKLGLAQSKRAVSQHTLGLLIRPGQSLPFLDGVTPLSAVADPSFEQRLAARLEVCSAIYDFATDRDATVRTAKRIALADLVYFFEHDPDASRLNSKLQRAIHTMICRNIFRADAQIPRPGDGTVSVAEPAWCHLCFCYRLLSLLLGMFPDAEFVNFYVFKRLLFLTQSPDQNERSNVSAFLSQYFDIRQAERLQCLRAVCDFLVSFPEQRPLPLCLGPLLLFLSHVATDHITQFRGPLTDLVLRAVVPLVRSRHLPLFLTDLRAFLILVADAVPDLRMQILASLQQFWPVSCPAKGHCFMDLIFALVIRMKPAQFAAIGGAFFAFVADHLQSSTFAVAAAALAFLIADENSAFLHANWRLIVEHLYDVIVELEVGALHVEVKTKAKVLIEKLASFHRGAVERAARKRAQDAGERVIKSWNKVIQACNWPSPEEEEKKMGEVQATLARPNDSPVMFISRDIMCHTKRGRAISMLLIHPEDTGHPALPRIREAARSADSRGRQYARPKTPYS
jgi:hypothetical protein